MVTKQVITSEKEMDQWLLDEDGIGTGLFGGEYQTQLNSGKKGTDLDNYIEDVKASARVAIDQSIGILTPWFFSNMPQFYYQTTPREEKVRDLHAVITGHIFESKQKLQLWNRDRSKTTFLAPGNEEGVFLDIAESIAELNIKHGSMFTSNDRLLLISSFFTEAFKKCNRNNPKNIAKIQRAKEILRNKDSALIDDFLENLDDDMVIHATPSRLAQLYQLFHLVRDREDAVSHLMPVYQNDCARMDIAYKKMPLSQTLPNILSLCRRYDFLVTRCVMATVNLHTETPVSILTLIIRHESEQLINEKFVPFLKINKAAKSLRWVDIDHFDDFWKQKASGEVSYSLNEINLIRSIAIWNQIFLAKINPYYYSEERIRKTFTRHPDLLRDLVDFFKLRFDPRIEPKTEERFREAEKKLREQIEDLADPIECDIFCESLNFLKHVFKTNYFYPRKTGLAFRMDPECLNTKHYPNLPFGFFFMVGRGYRGFQVRYRDTARGGMRIVMPKDASQYEAAFAGLFDEVVGLSYAQQLKNKDIPEGGAKAVLLLTPGADRETAALGAVDSILNLIKVSPETGRLDPSIIDYFGPEENIYLGPDENCTNELIEAFVRQANRQGYRFANAFMSSKPGAGINHKEYGVTSEGVNVYLENMLKELGIDPQKNRFTIKMTGGPDGDVAGNELKILHREYGENARVVAVADGLGAARDPRGLDWGELLRLVKESRSICEFNPEALSGEGAFVIPADTVEHTRIRNSIHASEPADIFIPAGGRPYTVNDNNWKQFLDPSGRPSVKAVVEGANIFFTDEARAGLQQHGVLIFKDSSANKCGVICSSFEIISSMILSPDEFMEIKPVYVQQVIEKLRNKADLEAKALLREFHERGRKTNLVELSKELSAIMNRVIDLVSADLDQLSIQDFRSPMRDQIILSYVPQILAEKYEDRILNNIPRSYRQAIISADTASRLVYSEGISMFDNLGDEDLVKTVKTYLDQDQLIQKILKAVEKATDLEFKQDIRKILNTAGARTLTRISRTFS